VLGLFAAAPANARKAPPGADSHAHPDPLQLAGVDPVRNPVAGEEALGAHPHVARVGIVGVARRGVHQVRQELAHGG